MKRLFKSLMALCLAGCCFFGMTACDEVKNGSKLKTVSIVFDVDGTEEKIDFELYVNLAPGTVDHFEYLSGQGYYDNTAVSNIKGHVEFGEFYYDGNVFKSKYDNDAVKSYYSLITSSYVSGKTIGPGSDPRYNSDFTVNGEFAKNGYTGNTLSLSGALVLKRDINTEDPGLSYNTGKATMAVTFGSDSYFGNASEFAVIGKVLTNDATDNKKSSYDRLKAIMTDNAEDEDGNIYYYYDGEVEVEGVGNYIFYSDDGKYFAQDETGAYTVELDGEEYDELVEDFAENPQNLRTLPAGKKITVKSITISKK